MAGKVPSVKLNDGHTMPVIGLGTWKSTPGTAYEAVKNAIDAGYRHLDCAFLYGNEDEVGRAIREKIAEGVVQRQDLFVVSKLWCTFLRPDLVEPMLRKSLEDLGLGYLDLYLIHWPVAFKENVELLPVDENGKFIFSDVDYVDTWKALEDCVRKGLVRSIGVSNFNSQQIDRILSTCAIKPVTNQVECHPYLNQKKLIDFCKDRDIVITAYSPLASPGRFWAKPEDPSLLEEPKLTEIAAKYKKSVAQVLLRYQIERGVVVIPKSYNKVRIEENFDIFDFTLSGNDITDIDSLNRNARFFNLTEIGDALEHPHFPFHIEF